jgi:hypothetical protein
MLMTEALIVQFSKIQSLLEESFKECLKRVTKLKRQSEESILNRPGFSRLPDEEILRYLQQLCPALYEIISDTLFRLIPLVQPGDYRRHNRLNFYFWPGYHSYLANKRIFVKEESWNFGIGLSGDPEAETFERYRDCSQARWYHYLVRKRNRSDVMPGDVHQWLRFQQQPQLHGDEHKFDEDSQKFVNSLTATIEAMDKEEQELFRGNAVLLLDACRQSTKTWGAQYAKFINAYSIYKSWTFPDRWGKPVEQEAQLRAARCKMHAVWLHAIFCDNKPAWLDDFIHELQSRSETQQAGEALKLGLEDKVAANWGDAALGRPRFSCWSYLSLHSSLAPSVSPMYDPQVQPEEARRRTLAMQSLGSAELLCSVPLRPRYISIVRPWISEVYGLVRNAEISILLQNHKLETRKAELAGPYWAHELMKLTDEGLSTILREAADTSPAAVSNRKFVLHSIRMMGSLAYAFTGPIFSGAQEARKQREEFLKPLRRLFEKGWLLEALRYVAEQTYENICYGRGAHVVFTETTAAGWKPEKLHYEEHRSCFLIVSEMVRNYCDSEDDECIATWKALVTDDVLRVELTGPTRAQRNPASMTLARLNVFLRALEIGKANVEWDKEQGMCAYIVEVDLAQLSIGLTEEKRLSTSDLTNKLPK